MPGKRKTKLRSDQWFNNPKNPDMTAMYLEKYMNYGLKEKIYNQENQLSE